MDLVIDGKSYAKGEIVNLNQRQLAGLAANAVDLSPMTEKDWLSQFRMTEEKYKSLTDNDKDILAGLANVEDYFRAFKMTKDQFMSLPEEHRLKLVGLAPDEQIKVLSNNSIVKIKGDAVTPIYTMDVFEIVKGENGELLRVDPQSGTYETLREAVASVEPEYRVLRDLRTDVVTYVDINTAEGRKAVDRATAENLKADAEVIRVGTIPSDQQRPAKAYYLEEEGKVVLSFDGGRTYVDDESGQAVQIPVEGSAPLSDQITNQVLSTSRLRRMAGNQLAQMMDQGVIQVKGGTRDNPADLTNVQRDNVRSAYQAALNGTGTWAKFQVVLDNVFAGALLPEGTFSDTQSNRQFLETIKILGRSALVVNPRFPVAEMQKVEGLFPDTDSFFRNAKTQADKLIELKDAAITQKSHNLQQIAQNPVLQTSDLQALIANNAEIDRLLNLLQGVPDRLSPVAQDRKTKVQDRLRQQREEREQELLRRKEEMRKKYGGAD